MKAYKATMTRDDNYITPMHIDDEPEYFLSFDKAKAYIEDKLKGYEFKWLSKITPNLFGTAKKVFRTTYETTFVQRYDVSIEEIEIS